MSQTSTLPSNLEIPFTVLSHGSRVGARADLDDVRIHSLHAELNNWGAVANELRPAFEASVQVTEPTENGSFVVGIDYTVTLTAVHETNEDEGTPAAEVRIGVAGLYRSADLPEDLTGDELKAFAESSGAMALHPFAREAVAATVVRFGLPSLLMPPLRVVSDSQPVLDGERAD